MFENRFSTFLFPLKAMCSCRIRKTALSFARGLPKDFNGAQLWTPNLMRMLKQDSFQIWKYKICMFCELENVKNFVLHFTFVEKERFLKSSIVLVLTFDILKSCDGTIRKSS